MAKEGNSNRVQIGRIVHFRKELIAGGDIPECRAALVADVQDHEGVNGRATLSVFTADGDAQVGKPAVTRDATGLENRDSWHWPPECPNERKASS